MVNVDIHKEVAYIVGRAQEGNARVVTLGALILFSTPQKDAWLLDVKDAFAMCLVEEGRIQPSRIVDTDSQFSIDWDQRFEVEGECLFLMDRAGNMTKMTGCPEILEAIEHARSTQGR